MRMAAHPELEQVVRRAVLAVAIGGTLLFCLLHAVSWLYPTVLETWARQAIAHEVQARVDTHLDGLSNSAIGSAARRMIDKNKQERAAADEQLAKVLPSSSSVMFELVIDAMLDPDCTCRGSWNGQADWLTW